MDNKKENSEEKAMEKQYEEPLFEVVLLKESRIVTASGDPVDPGPNDHLPDVGFDERLDENHPTEP